jgi:glyceraldehyde-3-phosphate dehydrogenase/erythrose-4-phosphate dehydrogenase
VSAVDLTVKAKETYEEIMAVLKNASETTMKGILGFTEDLVVFKILWVIQERLLLTLMEELV